MLDRILNQLTTRGWNIALRTAHIATMGVLLGGHAFNRPPGELKPWLWWTVGTGLALCVSEAGASLLWFHQLRGLMTFAKLLLICAVPLLWSYRLPVLLAVVVIGSVGSHMPARFRYYSVVYRQVVACHNGPGSGRMKDEEDA